jgi:hypothetical protein
MTKEEEDEIIKKAEEIHKKRKTAGRVNSFKNASKIYVRWECNFQEYGCSSDQVVVNLDEVEDIVLSKLKNC